MKKLIETLKNNGHEVVSVPNHQKFEEVVYDYKGIAEIEELGLVEGDFEVEDTQFFEDDVAYLIIRKEDLTSDYLNLVHYNKAMDEYSLEFQFGVATVTLRTIVGRDDEVDDYYFDNQEVIDEAIEEARKDDYSVEIREL